MPAHPTHDWSSVSGHCINCGCHVLGLEASMRCRPSTADVLARDDQPSGEIDYAAITRDLSG